MDKLNQKLQADLQKLFGNRVSFRKVERKLYGHDIAAIPGLIKPFIGNTVPEAVVQSHSEPELTELVRWAVKNGIALTPRGKGSSGYGGVIPVEGGIVVDFYRMHDIKHIDTENNTVTVEAGAVWEVLDKELMKHGLTLRLYPSSYGTYLP